MTNAEETRGSDYIVRFLLAQGASVCMSRYSQPYCKVGGVEVQPAKSFLAMPFLTAKQQVFVVGKAGAMVSEHVPKLLPGLECARIR